MRKLLFWFALAVLPVAAADQPRIVNGKLESRPAAKGLESEVRALVSASSSPMWIAYGVPMVEGRQETCSQSLSLDTGTTSTRDSGRVALEGERTLLVFLRAEKGQIGKGRAVSANCDVDAGGATVLFLTGGRAEESLSSSEPPWRLARIASLATSR